MRAPPPTTPRSRTGSRDQLEKDGEKDPPRRRALRGHLRQALRYGENPHQHAAFYATGEKRFGVATAEQLQGKELSYNNINDTDAAYELVAEFGRRSAACAIIKHANPCGVALGANLVDAYKKALACDPVSAFGGILAFNRTLDGATAEEIAKLFTEVIIAPDADDDARSILSAKKNLRLLDRGRPARSAKRRASPSSTVAGGFLVQTRDNGHIAQADLKIVTKRQPTDAGNRRHAVRLHRRQAREVEHHRLCEGRTDRRHRRRPDEPRRCRAHRRAQGAAKQQAAAGWAEPLTKGSAAASDAFFPFADGLLVVAEAGATAVIQPGGSIRDDEVIKAADEAESRHGLHRDAPLPALGAPARVVHSRITSATRCTA